MQLALGTDPVGVIAPVNAAQVHGGHLHAEIGVLVFRLPLLAQVQQFPHRLVQAFQGITAQAGV